MMDKSQLPPRLPGTKPESDISHIYARLLRGESVTSLDAVFSNNTVCLPKYISIMRNRYSIPIIGTWEKVSKRKKVKRYRIGQ